MEFGENKILVSSFSNFIVRIFVVGYKNKGESNVILFFDQDKVVFSAIVDCYKMNDKNLTIEILKKYGVKKLDFACWTHPHDDHSPGFDDVVLAYSGPQTIVYHPGFRFENFDPQILKSECTSANNVYSNLASLNRKKPYKGSLLQCIDTIPNHRNSYDYILVDKDDNKKEVVFGFLTPFKQFVCQYGYLKCKQKLSNVNDLSISFVMSVDKYDFFFGGDTELKNAAMISEKCVSNMRWVKVPHHCSDGAEIIANRLDDEQFDCAASTVFSPKLPLSTIQDIYKSKGRLFMTQLNSNPSLKDYGIVQFDYRFGKDKIKISTTLYDNAYEYK